MRGTGCFQPFSAIAPDIRWMAGLSVGYEFFFENKSSHILQLVRIKIYICWFTCWNGPNSPKTGQISSSSTPSWKYLVEVCVGKSRNFGSKSLNNSFETGWKTWRLINLGPKDNVKLSRKTRDHKLGWSPTLLEFGQDWN